MGVVLYLSFEFLMGIMTIFLSMTSQQIVNGIILFRVLSLASALVNNSTSLYLVVAMVSKQSHYHNIIFPLMLTAMNNCVHIVPKCLACS